MSEKVSFSAQFQLLAKMISNKDFTPVTMNNLTEEHFFLYPAEFNFIKNHYDYYGNVPDKLTFLEHFSTFVEDETHWPIVTEPDTYLLEQVEDAYVLKYGATKFNEYKELAEAGKAKEAKACLAHLLDDLHTATGMKCIDLFTDWNRFDTFVDKVNNPYKQFIKTGFPELDEAIGGIDPLEEDMVIAARTGVGKTWSLIIMAIAAAAQGYTVGFYSGEMTTDKIGYRLDTLIGHLNNSGMMYGNKMKITEKDYAAYRRDFAAKVNSFMLNRYGCPAKLNEDGSLVGSLKVITPNDIPGAPTVDALKGFVEKYKINILFIDQYSLLEDTSKARVEHERVANISKAVKKLQVEKRIPIISVSQMNRSKNEDGKQDTTQIALSDRIGQDATTILMLEKQQLDTGIEVHFGRCCDQVLNINVVKARNGGDGKLISYVSDFNEGWFMPIESKAKSKMSKADKEKAKEVASEYEC